MKLAFVYNKKHYEKIKNIDNLKIVSMSRDINYFLNENEVEFKSYNEYVDESKIQTLVDSETVNLSLNWPNYVSDKNFKNLITHKSILFSDVVNLGLELYYQKALVQIEIIYQIIKIEFQVLVKKSVKKKKTKEEKVLGKYGEV